MLNIPYCPRELYHKVIIFKNNTTEEPAIQIMFYFFMGAKIFIKLVSYKKTKKRT